MLRAQKVWLASQTSLCLKAFKSHAFAKTQFPRVSDKAWEVIIGIAKKQAETHGYDVSIFDHMIATRNVATADTSEITLDFGEFETELDEVIGKRKTRRKPETSAPTRCVTDYKLLRVCCCKRQWTRNGVQSSTKREERKMKWFRISLTFHAWFTLGYDKGFDDRNNVCYNLNLGFITFELLLDREITDAEFNALYPHDDTLERE